MRILITGVAGFIGSTLAEKLINLGFNITGIDNFDPFYSKSIKESNLANLLKSPNFKFHEIDIRDIQVHHILKECGIDLVIHLAAKAGVRPSIDNVKDYYDVNVNGTLNILEGMKVNHINKMVFASSSSIYGNNEKVPFSESDRVDNPISPYAATKKSGELLCHVYHHLYGFNISCLRFFTVYGPRQRPDLAISKFTKLIGEEKPLPFYGDGSTARDYTYVDDIVDGVIGAMRRINGYNIYNIGESQVVTLNELIAVIEKAVNKKAILNKMPMQPGDVKITYANIAKAQSEIDYNPKTKIENGIKEFVKWYNNNA